MSWIFMTYLEIDQRKAGGFDDMPPKLMKSDANELRHAVTH